MENASGPDANGSGKGAFALFAGSVAFAFANFGRLLLWAFPLPLFGLASAYLTGDPASMLEGMDILDAPEGQAELGEGEESAIDDDLFESHSHDTLMRSLAIGFITLLLAAPLQLAVQRNLLLGTPLVRSAYVMLFTSRLVWRYAALVAALSLAAFIPAYVLAEVLIDHAMGELPVSGLLPEDTGRMSGGLTARSFALFAFVLFAAAAGFLVLIKLSLAPALLAKGDPRPLRSSWRATRGGVLRLIALYLLCMIAAGFAESAAVAVLGGLARDGLAAPMLVVNEAIFFMSAVMLAAAEALYLKARLNDGVPSERKSDSSP